MGFLWSVLYLGGFLTTINVKTTTGASHDMTLDAQQILIEELGPDGLDKIIEVVPIHRQDLDPDYVACYAAVYKTFYYIVRSGPQTGDYEIVSHGDNPSPTSQVRDSAIHRGTTCAKFYMVSTTGDVACTNPEGKFAAISIPDKIMKTVLLVDSEDDIDVAMVDNFIRSKSDEQAKLFREHAKKVLAEEGLTGKEEESVEESSNEQESRGAQDEEEQEEKKRADPFLVRPITPGSPIQVVTGHISTLEEVRVRSLAPDTNEKRDAQLKDHRELCLVVIGCVSTNEKHGVISREHIEQHTNFIDLELDPDTKEQYNKREFVFALDIVKSDGSVTTRHYGVMYPAEKQKRRKQYRSWTSWTYYSIGREDLFPDYDQFKHGKCDVGCGPVAWAMVFGYYDRRSHYSSSYSGSTNLYRTGIDGTTGSSSRKAPKINDYRMKRYIIRLYNILDTFCLRGGGATKTRKMKQVSSFFKARQTTGSPKIIDERHWLLTPLAAYSNKVRDWVKSCVKKRWPVVIGWRLGFLKWHYPVVTRLRRRTRQLRICFLFICGKWKTWVYYEMFIHMGWGVDKNGKPVKNKWTTLNAYYGAAAVY